MSRLRITRLALTALAALTLGGFGTALAVEQTGELHGIVRDEKGQTLPGATVTLTGTNLPGQRATVSDENGAFRFLTLPPGPYSVRLSSPERLDVAVNNVAVNIGRASRVDVTMRPAAVAESTEVLVTGRVPFIDERRTTSQETFDTQYLQNTTISSAQRDYLSVIGQAAGTIGTGNTSVRGATAGENVYLVDGVDSTDPVTSTFGTNFIFDAIQEVQLQTGAFSAEFGRASGGVVNAVTKSGGNEFSGTLDLRYRTDSFVSDNKEPVGPDNVIPEKTNLDQQIAEGTFGGPILRDKLWFFLAGSYTNVEQQPTGSLSTRKFDGLYYLGKLTWQQSANHRLSLQYTADPADIDNDDADALIMPEATTFQTQGSNFLTARYLGVLSPSLTLEAQAARYKSYLDAYPQSGDLDTQGRQDFQTGQLFDNAINAQYSDRYRNQVNASLTWTPSPSHRIKGGVDYQDVKFETRQLTPGGGYTLFFDPSADPGDEITAIEFVDFPAPQAEDGGEIIGLFLQDEWRVTDRFTVNAGVRWDSYSYDNDTESEVFKSDILQPRLGVAWDLTGRGTDVLKASYSVFAHTSLLAVPSVTNSRNNVTEQYVNEELFGDLDGDGFLDPRLLYAVFGGPSGSLFARNGELDATNVKEWSISYEKALTPTTGVTLTYVERDTDDIIEDYFDPTVGEFGAYVIDNLEGLDRTYEGIEARLRTQWRKLYANASYTYSKSEGNIEYTQSIGSDFDFEAQSVNRYGNLSTDARHAFKLQGYVEAPWGLQFGFNGRYFSGFPYNRVVTPGPESGGYGEEFVEPRGSRRLPDFYQIDLDARKYFNIRDLRLALILAVQNVTNEQEVTQVQEFDEGGFGVPLDRQDPRRYEIGGRIEF